MIHLISIYTAVLEMGIQGIKMKLKVIINLIL